MLSFKMALTYGDLPAMQEAWRQLGSPSLDGWTVPNANGFRASPSTAIDLFYEGFDETLQAMGKDRVDPEDLQKKFLIINASTEDSAVTHSSRERRKIIAWLQGLGSRFTWKRLRHYGALEDLCAEGLDLTGIDLHELWQDWGQHPPSRLPGPWPGSLEVWPADLSLTATIFSSSQYFVDGFGNAAGPPPNGRLLTVQRFLKAGAGMYPLDQPGASALSPPPLPKRGCAPAPDDALQQLLRIFWPDMYPRKRADRYVPVKDINVHKICSFYKLRRQNEAWERRRLTLLCLLGEPQPTKAAKRAKTAELQGELVRNVCNPVGPVARCIFSFL